MLDGEYAMTKFLNLIAMNQIFLVAILIDSSNGILSRLDLRLCKGKVW
jgi:cobalamin-dependent methionine synthase I